MQQDLQFPWDHPGARCGSKDVAGTELIRGLAAPPGGRRARPPETAARSSAT